MKTVQRQHAGVRSNIPTEIAGLDNDGPTKMQGWTLQDWTQTDGMARVDITGLDIVGPVWQGWTLQDWTMTDD